MAEPLTDAQLQEYAALAEKAIERHEPYVARVLRELLAEVERLRIEGETLRAENASLDARNALLYAEIRSRPLGD